MPPWLPQLPEFVLDELHVRIEVLVRPLDVAEHALERRPEAQFADMEVRDEVIDVGTVDAVVMRRVTVLFREPPAMLRVNHVGLHRRRKLRLEVRLAKLVVHATPLPIDDAQLLRRLGIDLHEGVGVQLAQARNLAVLRMEERVGACAGREHEGAVLQELGRADGAEVGLLVIGQRIVPELLKPEVVEFDTTRGSIEARSTIRPHETLLVLLVDVLLVDDIQFIIGKEATQLEFFNTFEALYQAGKQLVISSDRPPSQMEQLDMRYRSRFNSGMTIDIQPPDFETSMAILKNKQEESELKLDKDILEYIATNIRSNIRDLEGAYNKIILYSKFKNEPITLMQAENALKDFISPDKKPVITAEYIIEIVAEHFNIDKEALLSSKKTKNLAYPRQICMYLCDELTNLTQQEIAEKLKRGNHTTVIHAINKINTLKVDNKELQENLSILKKKINP